MNSSPALDRVIVSRRSSIDCPKREAFFKVGDGRIGLILRA
jgi:hypothetical protein